VCGGYGRYDTSRGRIALSPSARGLIRLQPANELFFIAAITAAELLHGVERAQPTARKKERSRFVEAVLAEIEAIDFDVSVARRHAVLWAALEKSGQVIGPYDLLIAATALQYEHSLVTLNAAEFRRVPGLHLIDPRPYLLK